MSFEIVFALTSAFFWAISAHVLNIAFQKNKNVNLHTISVGLYFALLFGVIPLTPVVFFMEKSIEVNIYIILAGIFTFPIATFMYYLSGIFFKARAQFAAQFSKVKPLITLILAYTILHETITGITLISAILIVIGIGILFIGIKYKNIDFYGLIFGLITAFSWAIGEIFIKLGIGENHPLIATWIALFSSVILFSFIALPLIYKNGLKIEKEIIYWPFMVHGIISFGLAYSSFFYSIHLIGVSKTILITTFWPVISLLMGVIYKIYKKEEINIPKTMAIAAVLFLVASLIQIIFT